MPWCRPGAQSRSSHPEVDGDRAVVAYRFGGVSHVSSPVQMPLAWSRHGEGNALKDQAYCERLGVPPLNSVECGRGLCLWAAADWVEGSSAAAMASITAPCSLASRSTLATPAASWRS